MFLGFLAGGAVRWEGNQGPLGMGLGEPDPEFVAEPLGSNEALPNLPENTAESLPDSIRRVEDLVRLAASLPEAVEQDLILLMEGWDDFRSHNLAAAKAQLVFERWVELNPEGAMARASELKSASDWKVFCARQWLIRDESATLAWASDKPWILKKLLADLVSRDGERVLEIVSQFGSLSPREKAQLVGLALAQLAIDDPDLALAKARRLETKHRSNLLGPILRTIAETDLEMAMIHGYQAGHSFVWGLSEKDPERLVRELDRLPPGGTRRSGSIYAGRFLASRGSAAAFRWANGLPDEQSRIGAKVGILEGVYRGDDGASEVLRLVDEWGWGLISADCRDRRLYQPDGTWNSDALFDLVVHPVTESLLELGQTDPHEALSYLSEFSVAPEHELMRVAAGIFQSWMEEEPETARQALAELPSPMLRNHIEKKVGR